MVDILYILKDKLLPIKGVPRKAEFIQQNRTEQNWQTNCSVHLHFNEMLWKMLLHCLGLTQVHFLSSDYKGLELPRSLLLTVQKLQLLS